MSKKMVLYILILIMSLFCVQSVSAASISVHPGDSIQSAVDKASSGDTVVVYGDNKTSYTYKESVYVDKKVNIQSNGNVVIEAKNTSASVFTVDSAGSGSSIQNFDLTNSNYCIVINNAQNCLISGNNIKEASLVGIQFYGDVSNSKVLYNQITGTDPTAGNGISFEYGLCSYNNITGNKISNFLNGILFNDESQYNSVEGNTVTCTGLNGAGIYATDNSCNMNIIGNTISGAEDGIAVQQIGTNTANNYFIDSNILSGNKNGFWIRLDSSMISKNTANSNTVSGIDITGRYNVIQDNTASYNGICGICLTGVCDNDYNVVTGNLLTNNKAGLNSVSQHSSYSSNTVAYNTDNGLIVSANNSSIMWNQINNNAGCGVLCIGLYNVIKSNQISGNNIGTYLQTASNADYNSVSYNDIFSNNQGIVSTSYYTQFDHNNIYSNAQNGILNTADHVSIIYNVIKNNVCSGVLSIGNYNSLISNAISGNNLGICLQSASGADNNCITSNSVTYNNNGINSGCSYSNFNFNTLSYNKGTGLTITGSNCLICGNLMSNNGVAGLTITSAYNNVVQNQICNNLYGASFGGSGSADFNFNSVVGNTYQLYKPSCDTIVNAQLNWWGSNAIPQNIYGPFNYSRWLVLKLTTDKTQIVGTSSNVVVDLNHDCTGVNISQYGHLGNGLIIQFYSTLGTINSKVSITNGCATAWFKSGCKGTAKITTVLNSQKLQKCVTAISAIRSVNLSNNAVNVSNKKTIQLTYNVPIKFGKNISIQLKSSNGKSIRIKRSIKSNVLTISHDALAKKTKYILIIHSGTITDMNNKAMPLYCLNFTTK